MKSKNQAGIELVRARTMVRNRLIYEMSERLGFSDMQIAHAHLKGDSARTIIVPGLEKSPEQLKEMASEYIRRFRGDDCGPLIRRNVVKKKFDKNTPMELRDIRQIITEQQKTVVPVETRKAPCQERSLFDKWNGHGDIYEQVQELRIKVEELTEHIRSNQAEPEIAQDATPQQILSKDRRFTSVSIPRELQAAIRQITFKAGADRGYQVATWELIAEALLGERRAQDLKTRFKEAAG